jgi:hypothetical protein
LLEYLQWWYNFRYYTLLSTMLCNNYAFHT